MRKFFVILCGLSVIGGAFGSAPDRYREPIESKFASLWLEGSSSYSTDLPTSIYTSLTSQLNDKTAGHNSHNGTYSDEGALVIWAAHTIWEHGAYICKTQIQSANRNGFKYAWFDYYWQTGAVCKQLCKPGWSGQECKDETPGCEGDWTPFGAVSSLLGKDGDKYRHTNDMEVLSFKNEKDGNSEAGVVRQTHHIVLGVVEEVENGVKVAPIKVVGQRGKTGGGISSWIESIGSNGHTTLLCPEGYVASNAGDKCVKNPSCTGLEALEWCDGFKTEFSPEEHKEVSDSGATCKKYRCINDNYGFESETKHNCVACDANVKSGVNNQYVCEKCAVGKCFNAFARECGNCNTISKLKIERGPKYDTENRECWRQTNAEKFWGCVMCPDEGKCYNKHSTGYRCEDC